MRRAGGSSYRSSKPRLRPPTSHIRCYRSYTGDRILDRAKPTLFIGSSAEGLAVAKAIQVGLADVAEVTVWDDGIFDLTESTLTSLLQALARFDFGVFVLSPDDILRIREKEFRAVRDNVVFELGLFLGRLGSERTFFVRPSGDTDLHLPSDLMGRTA